MTTRRRKPATPDAGSPSVDEKLTTWARGRNAAWQRADYAGGDYRGAAMIRAALEYVDDGEQLPNDLREWLARSLRAVLDAKDATGVVAALELASETGVGLDTTRQRTRAQTHAMIDRIAATIEKRDQLRERAKNGKTLSPRGKVLAGTSDRAVVTAVAEHFNRGPEAAWQAWQRAKRTGKPTPR